MDFASSGREKGSVVYFTVYEDRRKVVERLVDVLQAYVDQFCSSAQREAWLIAPLDPIPVIEWDVDDEGNWTGTLKTEIDKQQEALIDRDVGYDFKVENIAAVSSRQNMIEAEDLSRAPNECGESVLGSEAEASAPVNQDGSNE